jgi:hypothetical protein
MEVKVWAPSPAAVACAGRITFCLAFAQLLSPSYREFWPICPGFGYIYEWRKLISSHLMSRVLGVKLGVKLGGGVGSS